YQYFKPDNSHDQRILKEFDKDYQSGKSIWWYTKDCCISKLLNKAFKSLNIDDIIIFNKFIFDINKQIKDQHKLFLKTKTNSIIQFYRGQFLSKDELNRLKSNVGQLISMNSFLITSTNKEKILNNLTNRSSLLLNDLIKIFIEINVNIQSPSRPFSPIKSLNNYLNEDDILFTCGCIFRLDEIYFNEDLQIWNMKITLCGDNDSDLKEFFLYLNSELNGINKYIYFGFYLFQMQKYKLCQEHFEKLLENQIFNDPIDVAYCHYGLSRVNYILGEYKSSINNLNKSLDCLIEYSQEEFKHKLIFQCYNDLGQIYLKQNQFLLSLQFYNKAININNEHLYQTYSGLAHIYYKLDNFHLSLEYLQKSLDNKFISSSYAFIAMNYISMGKIYTKLNEQDKALEMFDKAIDNQLKIVNDDHPDLSYTYRSKSLLYYYLNDQDKALEFIEQTYYIQCQSLPNYHLDFRKTYEILI
ncbi:unnamed protein product, partial [Adineta steineri]